MKISTGNLVGGVHRPSTKQEQGMVVLQKPLSLHIARGIEKKQQKNGGGFKKGRVAKKRGSSRRSNVGAGGGGTRGTGGLGSLAGEQGEPGSEPIKGKVIKSSAQIGLSDAGAFRRKRGGKRKGTIKGDVVFH